MAETKEQLHRLPEIQTDEIGVQTAEELATILKKDIKLYKGQLDRLDKDVENYKKQFELAEKIWALMSNKETYKKINPTFEFETDEYWALQYEQNQFKIRNERAQSQSTLECFVHQKEAITADMNDKIEKLEALGVDNE